MYLQIALSLIFSSPCLAVKNMCIQPSLCSSVVEHWPKNS